MTLGTPFRGSIEAIVMIATGMSLLSGNRPSEREREAARLTPSVYRLFPSFKGAAVDTQGSEVDLFDPASMQSTVLDSIGEYVRQHSVRTLSRDRPTRAREILGQLLKQAQEHRERIRTFKPEAANLREDDWLGVVGVADRTRLQLTVEGDERGGRFMISDEQFVNELTAGQSDTHRTGDGTVPVAGACPPFLPPEALVCVTQKDLSLFEIRNQPLNSFVGLHAILPLINLVQRLAVPHLFPGFRGKVSGRHPPGVGMWDPPIAQLEDRGYGDLA